MAHGAAATFANTHDTQHLEVSDMCATVAHITKLGTVG